MASRLSAGAPAGSDRMLFIVEGPSHFPGENRRTAVSHARRWQTSQIHRERRIAAQQGAEYARSLVGWGRAVNASGSIIRPLLPSIPRRAEKDLLEQVAATIPQEICAGLRNDPFDALPVNLTGVGMKMIDYWFQEWTRLKASHVDNVREYNTYIDFFWPLAMQDEMFMHATLANIRGAWCIANRLRPENDSFVLSQGRTVMAKLRNRISLGLVNLTTIWTMEYMINVAFLINDHAAFSIHWKAFRLTAQKFMSEVPRNDKIAGFMTHRLRSWHSLHEYKRGAGLMRQSPEARLVYAYGGTLPQLRHLPPGFLELMRLRLLSLEVAAAVDVLSQCLEANSAHTDAPIVRQQIFSLLSYEKLSDLEACICHALFALLVVSRAGRGLIDSDLLDSLHTLAQSFISRKRSAETEWLCITWCALAIGHVLMSFDPSLSSTGIKVPGTAQIGWQEYDSTKLQTLRWIGRSIILSMTEDFSKQHHRAAADLDSPGSGGSEANWTPVNPILSLLSKQFLTTPDLLREWQITWELETAREQESEYILTSMLTS